MRILNRPLLLCVGGVIVVGGLVVAGFGYFAVNPNDSLRAEVSRRPVQVVINSSKSMFVDVKDARCQLRPIGPLSRENAHPLARQWLQVADDFRKGKIGSRECGIRLDQIRRDASED